MKGFKDSNNKFHPMTEYKKGTRKSRDQSAKTQGVRLKRKGQLFKPQESRNVMVTENEVIIWDDAGVEVAIWVKQEWEEDPESAIPAIRNAIRLANQGKVEELKKMIDFNKFHPIQEKTRPRHLDRKARDSMSGYDSWVTSAPPDPEQEALDIVVSENLDLTAEQIAKIKPSWWDKDDTDTIGDLFTVGTIKKKLHQEREMNEYFEEEAKKARMKRDPPPTIMKPKTIKEFNTMTLSKATDFKKALGMEGVSIDFMDHRSKEYERLDKLHWKNVRNLSDSKWGSAVQDELQRRQMEK